VGPTSGLDDVNKRKFLALLGIELYPSVVQAVDSRYFDYAINACKKIHCFNLSDRITVLNN
jgi:hypothetical protein